MFGVVASMTQYSKSKRDNVFGKPTYPAGPGSHFSHYGDIQKHEETLAPFNTTGMQRAPLMLPTEAPPPNRYTPRKLKTQVNGAPLMECYRTRSFMHLKQISKNTSLGPGKHYLPNLWKHKKHIDVFKRNVTSLYVSNNVPTIFHPLDIRCFVEGVDGRMYPWKIQRSPKIPFPTAYDTSKCVTSSTLMAKNMFLDSKHKRLNYYIERKGPGPTDHFISRRLNDVGGIFLSKTVNPLISAPRTFDIFYREAEKQDLPTPFNHCIPSQFDNDGKKKVTWPFNSTAELYHPKPPHSPGPCPPEEKKIEFDRDIVPPVPKPFDSTEKRFSKLKEMRNPGPAAHYIMSFAEEMCYRDIRHAAAIPNPKLGFGISSEARPKTLDISPIKGPYKDPVPPRQRNKIVPTKLQTYSYLGAPEKFPDSPGPIHNTRLGEMATLGKKSFWNPRELNRFSAFLNSGCERKMMASMIKSCTPAPSVYYPQLPKNNTGVVILPLQTKCEPSDVPKVADPDPRNPKDASSIWRANDEGTFNVKLKKAGRNAKVRPSAGGFHPFGALENFPKIFKQDDKIPSARLKKEACYKVPMVDLPDNTRQEMEDNVVVSKFTQAPKKPRHLRTRKAK